MHRRILPAALAIGLSLGAALLAQGFQLRTGAWSFTMTMQGMSLEGLPPEARAQLERPQTFKSCVTAEDLKNLNLGRSEDSDDEDCKTVSSKVTATVADIVRQCSGDEPGTETSHFEAATPQSLKGSVTKKSAQGTMTMTMTGKWVGPKCVD